MRKALSELGGETGGGVPTGASTSGVDERFGTVRVRDPHTGKETRQRASEDVQAALLRLRQFGYVTVNGPTNRRARRQEKAAARRRQRASARGGR